MNTTELTKRIGVAIGEAEADLIIKNAHIYHLTTGDFEDADIAIAGDTIVGIGKYDKGKVIFDANGMTAVPGFIDAHLHVESSLVTPPQYQQGALLHGVTTAICDPHELSNVVGSAAFEYFQECAKHLAMDLIVRLSPCVPATPLENSGATIDSAEMKRLKEKYPQAQLGEFMNVPGVIMTDPEVMNKALVADFIDGHCPLLGGNQLNAYLSAGVQNDHECSNLAEATEKLRRGMAIFIRNGSVARNLHDLLPLITVTNSPYLAFCSDDPNPLHVRNDGYLDGIIAQAIAEGAPTLAVYRTASLSAARLLNLNDRGIIAPGKRADIVLLSDLKKCVVEETFVKGKRVCDELFANTVSPDVTPLRNTVICKAVTPDDFILPTPSYGTPVIGVKDGSLITDYLHYPVQDLAVVSVIERHGKTGNISRAYVSGFQMTRGAIASSVGHDSHNICVVGTNPDDMAVAVNALRDCQGGYAVAIDGNVTGLLPLPIGGLMSDRPGAEVVRAMENALAAAAQTGCPFKDPFMSLAFIPLPVIPFLKLTDCGLVDVNAFKFVEE